MNLRLSRRLLIALAAVVTISLVALIIWVTQQGTPATPRYTLELLADGLTDPTHLTHAGDERLFVVERAGVVRIIENGALLPEPFLDIQDQVDHTETIEAGLLSIVFEPDYAETRRFYVRYIAPERKNRLVRYTTLPDNPNRADVDSAEILIEYEQVRGLHTGGYAVFGPDGYLYVTNGDGGNHIVAPLLDNFVGKILRIDVSPGSGYTIPPDNPFVDTENALPEIWAYGLRNPWRIAFDPETDDLYIADVGESSREEINVIAKGTPGGLHFGWPYFQGQMRDFFEADVEIDSSAMVFPVYEYEHKLIDEQRVICAVIGGYVYRGDWLDALRGKYLFGDWCSGQVWTLEQRDGNWEAAELLVAPRINSFGQDQNGEIYVLTFSGEVFQLASES